MYQLLIVDDEPLVLAGIKSMINWDSLGIEIAGTAVNGQQAFDIIQNRTIDIVISDIKMPVMDGFELFARCRNEMEHCPEFIVLTSYEEVSYLRKAIELDTAAYLIKLELTEKSLRTGVIKALKEIEIRYGGRKEKVPSTAGILKNAFFIRLLNNVFKEDKEENLKRQAREYGLEGDCFVVVIADIRFASDTDFNEKERSRILVSAMQLLEETAGRKMSLAALPLSVQRFALVLGKTDSENANDFGDVVVKILDAEFRQAEKYFKIRLRGGIGRISASLKTISLSYAEARDALSNFEEDDNALKIRHCLSETGFPNHPELYNFNYLQSILETCDSEDINQFFIDLMDDLYKNRARYAECLDIGCRVMYEILATLPDGHTILDNIYKDWDAGYKSVYLLNTPGQILEWLDCMKRGLIHEFSSRNRGYRDMVSHQIKIFLDNHYMEKIGLHEIADHFNMSPNYLSTVFNKVHKQGIAYYQNSRRIEKAKELLIGGKYRIYEISEMTGFESPFYFSKVFKKITGISPKNWLVKNSGIKTE